MDVDDGLRAADADREVVAERRRRALGEGRLDLGEYDERLRLAYTGRTYTELKALLVDLPGQDATVWSGRNLITAPLGLGTMGLLGHVGLALFMNRRRWWG